MNEDLEILDHFIDQARAIRDGERRQFTVTPHDLARIADEAGLRSAFERRINEMNDPELRKLLQEFVRDMIDLMEDAAAEADRKVEALDRAGLAVAASVTVAGIGATAAAVASGAAATVVGGALVLLVGGLAGLIICTWGRDRLKRDANRSKSWSRKFRRLIGKD